MRQQQQQEAIKSKIKSLDSKTMPQITVPGMYWFTDLDKRKWFVQITDQKRLNPKQATMLEVDSIIIKEVDSIGVGEFIGPITPLSGY